MTTSKGAIHAIAMVGVAAQLPSGGHSVVDLDYTSFIKFLFNHGEAYEKIPPERFNIHTYKGKDLGKVCTDTGAFLKNVQFFDFLEFGMLSKDARLMPISTRKLIETTFLSLIDSGIHYRGKNVGCYMAGVCHDMFMLSGHDDAEIRGAFSLGPSGIANRVSYHLDLRGPSIPVDTACSSTLHAMHLAVQALRAGDCDAAVVGGSQINARFADWINYSQGGVLSPDGKCKPFDASADGFGRGEGVVSIVLKPLEDAVRDHDKIYATILGTGVNSCGSLAPVNAPVASAQQDAMLRAFAQAGCEPRDVDFIELHATGTAQGDPTEANWVGAQFSREEDLVVGSVKGNLGHLEITAFLASLLKVCGIFETGLIPPNVNFKIPNPAIRWKDYRLRVPIETEPLRCRPCHDRPLVALTSSGIGGANGHCVVEGPPIPTPMSSIFWSSEAKRPALLVASGLTPNSAAAVGESIKTLAEDLEPGALAQVSRTYGRRSRSMTWRSFAIAAEGLPIHFPRPSLSAKAEPNIVFVFSGQGPQHIEMGRDLFNTCDVFRTSVMEMDAVLEQVCGVSLIKDLGLFGSEHNVKLACGTWPIAVTLPALAILQLALIDALATIGIKPDAIVGHSAGETALIYASGAGSKAMAVELAIARGKAMSLLEDAEGTMAAVSCSASRVAEIIANVVNQLGPGVLEIACYNSPDAVSLSGSSTHIDLAVEKAKSMGILATRLRTRIPVHSSLMDLCKSEYQRLVGDVFARYNVKPPSVEMYSTLTGALYKETLTAKYFWKNAREPVQFTNAINAVSSRYPDAIYVEISPHPVLSAYVAHILGKEGSSVCMLRRPKASEKDVETITVLQSLGKIILQGYNSVDFDALYGTSHARHPTLPVFPLARKEVAYLAPTFDIVKQHQRRNGPLNYPQLALNSKTHSVLAEHVIKDEPIMPAAGFLEMALEFGARRLWNVEFVSFLPFSSERPTPVNVKLDGIRWTVCSASTSDASVWPLEYHRLHAQGYLSLSEDDVDDLPPVDLDDIRSRIKLLDMKGFYDDFSNFATFGPKFQRILSCGRSINLSGTEELLVELRGADEDLSDCDDYIIHPAILDAAIHVLVHPALTGIKDKAAYYLPSSLGTLIVHDDMLRRPFPQKLFTYATFSNYLPDSMTWNATIVDEDGIRLCTVENIQIALHEDVHGSVSRRFEVLYQPINLNVAQASEDNSTAAYTPVLSKPTTIQVDTTTLSTGEPGQPHDFVISYVRGLEILLQPFFSSIDPLSQYTIWFTAIADENGDAVFGFTKALRSEYRSWSIYAVVFDKSWTTEQQKQAVKLLATNPGCENEMTVAADGAVSAPRVVLSSPPARLSAFSPESPWTLVRSKAQNIPTPSIPEDHVLIHVTHVLRHTERLWTYFGTVDGASEISVGLSNSALSNIIVAHKGSIVVTKDLTDLSPCFLASVIVALAVGINAFAHSQRLQQRKILVTDSDTELGADIVAELALLGVNSFTLPSHPTPLQISAVLSDIPDLIISGRSIVILDDLVARGSRLFFWNDTTNGVENALLTDPWIIGDILRVTLQRGSSRMRTYHSPLELLGEIPSVVPSGKNLFDPSKSYLLVGGVGSLGIRIALWMYQKGARSMVLTSRSGRASLQKKDEFASIRILKYLEGLPDLKLRVEAADATSKADMQHVVDCMKEPIGGCMMLSVVFQDRSFATHTAETFEITVTSKVLAFHTLEEVLAIPSLDFLVAYSSVCGLVVGNAGQTNYGCANTAMMGMARKYPNAVSISAPYIHDTGYHISVSTTDIRQRTRFRHISKWGITCSKLFECIEDGLLKLRENPIWQYVPDVDWRLVRKYFGASSMYDHLVPDDNSSAEVPPQENGIRDFVCTSLDLSPDEISADIPLTSYGLDSLSAASLAYSLRSIVPVTQLQLLADMTLGDIERRSQAISNVAPNDQVNALQARDLDHRAAHLINLVEHYTSGFAMRDTVPTSTQHNSGDVVFITGASGRLGAHVLAELLQSPSCHRIYAHLRDPSIDVAAKRLVSTFKTNGLNDSLLFSEKLKLLNGNLLDPTIGLPLEVFEQIRNSLTHIFCLGWLMDFFAPVNAFDPVIRTIRRLVDIASRERNGPLVKLIFCSSPAVFQSLEGQQEGPALEAPIDDPTTPLFTGYPESKWIVEQMLSIAGKHNLVSPLVVRVAQMSSAKNGAWKTSEWVPSMICASYALGCLPGGYGAASWIPADMAAAAIVEIMNSSKLILHLRHPNPVSWAEVMAYFSRILNLPIVPYSDWIQRLERGLYSGEREDCSKYLDPALRLLDFFRNALKWDSSRDISMENSGLSRVMSIAEGYAESIVLRSLDTCPISLHDVEKWVGSWRKEGFLPLAEPLC